MAVAAADFYTYARATGTPLPKSKQEEAELTPVINRWKKERLNDTREEEGGNNVAALGALAGVGALALAGLNRRPLQRRVQTTVQVPDDVVTTGVGGIQRDLNKKVTTGADTSWEAKKSSWETTTDKVDPDLESLADEQIDVIRGTVANPKLYPETTSEIRRQQARARKIQAQLAEAAEPIRRDLIQEGIEETQSGKEITAFRRKWGIDPTDPGAAVKNEEVWAKDPGGNALSTNDFLQANSTAKYIDPEDIVTSPGGNVPKSETASNQTVNALGASEDQQTGRVVRSLQRNEDLDQGKIAFLEDVTEDANQRAFPVRRVGYEADAAINKVASELPDGLPLDQAEQTVGLSNRPNSQDFLDKTIKPEIIRVQGRDGTTRFAEVIPEPPSTGPTSTIYQGPVERETIDPSKNFLSDFLQDERSEIGSQLGEQGQVISPGRVEQELSRRMGKESSQYGKDYTQRKHAMQLGVTYDPEFTNDLSLGGTRVSGEYIPRDPEQKFITRKTPYTGTEYLDDYQMSLRTPFYNESTAKTLESNVNNAKNWLGEVRLENQGILNQIYKERRDLIEQKGKLVAEQLEVAKVKGAEGRVRQLSTQLTHLRKLWKNPELGMHREGEVRLAKSRIRGATKSINESIGQMELPLQLTPGIERGQRLIYEVDPRGGRGGKVGKQLVDINLDDDVIDSTDMVTRGQVLPETVELRSERLDIDLNEGKGKGGGGRKVADYTGAARVDEPVRPLNTGGLLSTSYTDPLGRTQTRLRPTTGRYRDYDIETGGAPQLPYQDDSAATGNKTDIYGVRLARQQADSPTARPTQLVGKVKGPQTQTPTAAMRGKSGTRVVNIAENIRHLSDPNWLTSQGYNLNRVSPQQLVGSYLAKHNIQRSPTPVLKLTDTGVDLAGKPSSVPTQDSDTADRLRRIAINNERSAQTVATTSPQPNYPGAQNQVNYVPANPKSVDWEGLKKTASEIEDAKQMHLLNYISAAHGQIEGGARVGGTKMRNNLTPYQEPSDAMIRQLIMKKRGERI